MNAWTDFSNAEQQTSGDIIPKGTLAKVHMKIRPGGYNDQSQGWTDGVATRSEKTGAVYLDCEFTVIGGPYNKRKAWSLIGLYSAKGPKWGEMGRSFVRAALEASKGIDPKDTSEIAIGARQIKSLADLDGLEFPVKIDVQEGKDGYDDKNVVQTVISATHKDYGDLMNGGGGSAPASAPPPTQQASAASKPAWQQ